MKKAIIVLVCSLVFLSGCSTLSTVAMAAQHTVDRYCSAPAIARNEIRSAVGKAVAPNSIHVLCASDSVEG
jgi:uncharacterized protein YceK